MFERTQIVRIDEHVLSQNLCYCYIESKIKIYALKLPTKDVVVDDVAASSGYRPYCSDRATAWSIVIHIDYIHRISKPKNR